MDPRYKDAMSDTVIYQVVLGIFIALFFQRLAYGVLLLIWCAAMVPFWVSVVVLLIRRPQPTRREIAYVRWGFVFAVTLTPLVTLLTWFLYARLHR